MKYTKENSFPLKVDPVVSSTSPSGKYRVVLQQVPDKASPAKKSMVIEVYDESGLLQQVKVDEFHEKIENNSVQGRPFTWSPDETKFLYIATPKEKKHKSFLDAPLEKDEEVEEALRVNEVTQDCGEQLVGIIKPKIYVYDLTQQHLLRVNLDDSLVPCFPQFLGDSRIVFQALRVPKEFFYGILHCFNRETDIYLIEQLDKDQIWPKPKEEPKKPEEEPKK